MLSNGTTLIKNIHLGFLSSNYLNSLLIEVIMQYSFETQKQISINNKSLKNYIRKIGYIKR